ncbi:MAG: hypothetical protein M1834_005422 [Cirrosporium novae-zelandiae]|nr:MAG: hypothetical protein M1834_005422 [Cirrosporium novae-zelandiae]
MSGRQTNHHADARSMDSFQSSHKSSKSFESRPSSSKKDGSHAIESKANPSLALNEAQPFAMAGEKSSLASFTVTPQKDMKGNIITEPDLSNPTRYRFERPLDTIRSFEAAIDRSWREGRK